MLFLRFIQFIMEVPAFLSILVKNIGFLVKNAPRADQKAFSLSWPVTYLFRILEIKVW